MSIWYQFDITAMGDRAAIGKFFNLDPENDIHYIDSFDFSFGQKNVPGLRLGKLIEQNPDLIFLVRMAVEVDTVVYSLENFNKETQKYQRILIQDSGYTSNRFNKRLLEEYRKRFPELAEKHLQKLEGFNRYRWEYLFNDFKKSALMLNEFEQYKEMVDLGAFIFDESDFQPGTGKDDD